jgi:hypothetical protein
MPLALLAQVSPAHAQGAGSFSLAPGSTFTGAATAASSHTVPPFCAPPPALCFAPNPPIPPVTGFIPGFHGKSFGRWAYEECRENLPLQNCHWWGVGSAWTTVDGIGTNQAVIVGEARADTSNSCECPAWGPISGTGSLNTHIELVVSTIPPGQSATVYFAWNALLNRSTNHEAGGEDPAYVQGLNGAAGVTFNINGTPLVAPGTGVNSLPGTPNAIYFLPANPGQSTGFILVNDGDTITIDLQAEAGATIAPPPITPTQQRDQSNASFFGKITLRVDVPLQPIQNPMSPGANVSAEFSVDIGSDAEMSDPTIEGNEAFDPGDMYPWFGPMLPIGGADGVRDDALAFQTDYWPLAPDGPPPTTGAPTCTAPFPPSVTPALVQSRFDIDGSDAIEPQLRFFIPPNQPLSAPLTSASFGGATGCIYADSYLLISFEDDWAPHYSWTFCPVPSERPAESGATYGTDADRDEVLMVTTTALWPPPPSGFPQMVLGATTPLLSEASLHPSLFPSPDPAVSQELDDDVDSLDVNLDGAACATWYITADHEATGLHPAIPGIPLDPGDIYEVLPLGGLTKVIDHAIHLGLPDGTDVSGFEFIWLRRCDPGNPTSCVNRLAILFGVTEDDLMTPVDDSGGLNPNMIYASFMMDENGDGVGDHFEYLTSPLQDCLDAITASPLPFVPATLPSAPPNDLCALSAPVHPGTSPPFPHFGANTDGPPEPGCGFTGLPGQDSDIWFQYIAPCDGISTISAVPVPASVPDRFLAVYPSCPAPGGGPPPIGCAVAAGGQPASVTVVHPGGQSFIIRVGMPNGQQGESIIDITVACSCPEDIDGNGTVDVDDLIAVVLGWGPCPGTCPPHCPPDIAPIGPPQGNCSVDVDDLIAVILGWGPCP